MAIYLIETDNKWMPLDPVGKWFGPVNAEIPCDWIAYERQCDNVFKIIPEIEFPSVRHYRRDDWLCVGMRPPRAFPRGLRLRLQADDPRGTEPFDIIGNMLECWVEDPGAASSRAAKYTENDGAEPRCSWVITTDVSSHSTTSNPLDYSADDFVCNADGRYVDGAGDRWRVLSGPSNYEGSSPLEALPIPALGIARRRLGTPVDKTRSLVLLAEEPEPQCEEPGTATLPFFDDFEPPSPDWTWSGGFGSPFRNDRFQPGESNVIAGHEIGSVQPLLQLSFTAQMGNTLAGLSCGFGIPGTPRFHGVGVGPGGGALFIQYGNESQFLRNVGIEEVLFGGVTLIWDPDTGIAHTIAWDIAEFQGSAATNLALALPGNWCVLPGFHMSTKQPGWIDSLSVTSVIAPGGAS